MNGRHLSAAAVALGVAAAAAIGPTGRGASADRPAATGPGYHAVCGPAALGTARCHSEVQDRPLPFAGTNPTAGYVPSDLQSAYNLASASTSNGGGQTVAIVDAYDDPSAESDLGVYRSQFGLASCTTANGCFRKVNQSGVSSSYPKANGGWAQEISLDLDMVSAICPNCHILLVEASSNSYANLGAAVDTAARLGATEISNSYGGSEFSGETSYDSHYNHPGIAVTVSSGDSGYGTQYPAASPSVTAAGGTTLTRTATGWTQSAWSSAGSGCSAYEAAPSWQAGNANVASVCTTGGRVWRGVADVAAVADPNTGVSVYDSYAYRGMSGWLVFGGTSVASPILASVYALAGNAGTVTQPSSSGAGGYGSSPYSATASSLTDVLTGSNGSCGATLCTAGPGWDGPTGLGTPIGTGAF